jgi:hypothetical protein
MEDTHAKTEVIIGNWMKARNNRSQVRAAATAAAAAAATPQLTRPAAAAAVAPAAATLARQEQCSKETAAAAAAAAAMSLILRPLTQNPNRGSYLCVCTADVPAVDDSHQGVILHAWHGPFLHCGTQVRTSSSNCQRSPAVYLE